MYQVLLDHQTLKDSVCTTTEIYFHPSQRTEVVKDHCNIFTVTKDPYFSDLSVCRKNWLFLIYTEWNYDFGLSPRLGGPTCPVLVSGIW